MRCYLNPADPAQSQLVAVRDPFGYRGRSATFYGLLLLLGASLLLLALSVRRVYPAAVATGGAGVRHLLQRGRAIRIPMAVVVVIIVAMFALFIIVSR